MPLQLWRPKAKNKILCHYIYFVLEQGSREKLRNESCKYNGMHLVNIGNSGAEGPTSIILHEMMNSMRQISKLHVDVL